MRLSTFCKSSDPTPRIGIDIDGRMLDLVAAASMLDAKSPPWPASMKSLLATRSVDAVRNVEREVRARGLAHFAHVLHAMSTIRWLPPVPDADKFLCVGKNYRTHLEELKRTDLLREMPQEPTAFVKLNSCLVGHDADVVRPSSVLRLDYEPELVFVIAKPAFQVKPQRALDYVAGITLLNDLTCRDTQKREVASGTRFWTAKNAPGFGPLGPAIVTMDEVGDPYDLWVSCSVNGEQRMRVNTSEQIWKLADILSHFSRLVPIQPGDMFSTGAPGGVAVGKDNAEALFLKPGDVVECAIERPSLVLRNRIVAPKARPGDEP